MVFEGVRGTSYRGDIAIDDITYSSNPCKQAAGYSCDFENGVCNYTQAKTDVFDWTRSQGRSQSTGTGPNNDHTYGTPRGHYMYIEASSPRRRGDNAQLLTPTYSSPSGSCLNFYYNMNGIRMGTLNVILVQPSQSGRRLWTKAGNQGASWQLAQVPVPASTSYQVMFEGIVGTGFQSDIAIDDISIKNGACNLPGTFCSKTRRHIQ